MRVIQIIDSLELNGGSTMFLDLVGAMREFWPNDEIVPIVVSKTGQYGRPNLISDEFPKSYNINDITVYNYEVFQDIAYRERNVTVFHHILGHTKPIRFHPSCRYILVNHAMTNVIRLRKFKPFYRLVSVCRYFCEQTKRRTSISSSVILNKISDHYKKISREDGPFIIGRCQRIVPSKFAKMDFADDIFPKGHQQVIVGPINSGKASPGKVSKLFRKNDTLVGTVFDRSKKLEMIRKFDVYLHCTPAAEGASIAVLEALSCGVPVLANRVAGGIRELIREGVNGYFFRKNKELNNILRNLQKEGAMQSLRKSTREDFLSRLHIKYSLHDYRQMMI